MMTDASSLVHLSDIECGPNNRAASQSVVDPYTKCAERLVDDVRRVVIEGRGVPGERIGLVISGDSVDKGGATGGEYRDCACLIETVRDALGVPRDQVAIVPGNHDVNWEACEKEFLGHYSRKDAKNVSRRKVARSYIAKTAAFSEFVQGVCGISYWAPETTRVFPGFARLGVALVGIDTTYPCTFCEDDNYGEVRYDQIATAGRELASLVETNPALFPIAVMHHCPIPVHDDPEERSYMQNATEVRQWLSEVGIQTVLCGHEHLDRVSSEGRRNHQVFTTGSFGLGLSALASRNRISRGPQSNKYQIVIVNPGGTSQMLFRKLDQPGAVFGKWVADEVDGQSVLPVQMRRRDWAGPCAGRVSAVRPLIGEPVLLPGRQRCVVSMGIGGERAELQQIDRVIYEIGDKRSAAQNRSENFAVVIEFEAQERFVDIRIMRGGNPDVVERTELPEPKSIR